jgi:hypothetical protein
MLRNLLLIACFSISMGAVAPRSVDASCGDWLAHSGQSAVADQPTAAAKDVPPARSCNGPLCKQSPVPPMPMPTPPTSERQHHEAACISGSGSAVCLNPVPFFDALAVELPSGHRLDVDRPPQS